MELSKIVEIQDKLEETVQILYSIKETINVFEMNNVRNIPTASSMVFLIALDRSMEIISGTLSDIRNLNKDEK